jgi:hypothetical protein
MVGEGFGCESGLVRCGARERRRRSPASGKRGGVRPFRATSLKLT